MYAYSCIIFFQIFWHTRSDDGCFVLPKHVAAVGFAVIKVVYRQTVSLSLREILTYLLHGAESFLRR